MTSSANAPISGSSEEPVSAAEAPRTWPAKRRLFGVGISETDYDEALAAILRAAEGRRAALVAHMPVHGLIEAHRDPSYRLELNDFQIVAPDGQPVRWALNWLAGSRLRERVYGPELMLRVCREASSHGLPVYLFGSTPDVVQRLGERLVERFPALPIVGVESPPFRPLTPEEDRALVDRINASGARIVFVGLGCPKQERFAFAHRNRIHAVQVCVGAAFDFIAGSKPMAPRWMQRAGLEWLFRVANEPRRLWRRYLVTNSVFIALVTRSLLGRLIGMEPSWQRPAEPS